MEVDYSELKRKYGKEQEEREELWRRCQDYEALEREFKSTKSAYGEVVQDMKSLRRRIGFLRKVLGIGTSN